MTGAGGVEIATWDLGGRGPVLVLSHATGFHSRCWSPLAGYLGRHHRVWALDHRGHGASGHAADGRYDDWSLLTDDLLATLDALGLDGVAGAGHSLGGAVLLLAQQRRPSAFTSLYCYEPIVVAPAQRDEGRRHNRLSPLSRKRRETFPSVDDARRNYAAKAPFSRFSPAALDAYVEGAFTRRAAGTVGLCCRPAEEASVYEGAFVHHAYEGLASVTIPVTVAGGGDGGDLGLDVLGDLADQLPRGRLETYEGLTHFGPMEDPGRVAAAILRTVDP